VKICENLCPIYEGMDVSGAVSPDLHGRVALIWVSGAERLRRGNGRGHPFDAAAERVWGNGRVGGNQVAGSGRVFGGLVEITDYSGSPLWYNQIRTGNLACEGVVIGKVARVDGMAKIGYKPT
jgi:hypothetical protein